MKQDRTHVASSCRRGKLKATKEEASGRTMGERKKGQIEGQGEEGRAEEAKEKEIRETKRGREREY